MPTDVSIDGENHKLIFPERLRKMRERRRISRSVMSEMCGLSKSAFSKYERGVREPKLETLILLSKFWDCSIDYLCGRTDHIDRY